MALVLVVHMHAHRIETIQREEELVGRHAFRSLSMTNYSHMRCSMVEYSQFLAQNELVVLLAHVSS